MLRRLLVSVTLVAAAAAGAAPVTYLPFGPQINVPVSTVTGGGWSQCYAGTMDQFFGFSAAATLAGCSGDRLLVAGRETGGSSFLVLAQALKTDVLFDTGAVNNNVTNIANGTGWYNADNFSFGFAPAGEDVDKSECDVRSGTGRLCLHTIANAGGFRFNNIFTFDSSYEKVIFTDTASAGAVPEPASWAMLIAGFGLVGATLRRRRAALAA